MHLSCARHIVLLTHLACHFTPLNNERAGFIVRSSAASVIKPDCNQKGGSFLSEWRRGASSLVPFIHDSTKMAPRTNHHSLMQYYPLGSTTPTPCRATIQFVGFGASDAASVAIYGPAGRSQRLLLCTRR